MHKKDFKPIPFFQDHFSQTILGSMFNFFTYMDAKTEYVRLKDGDLLALEVATPKNWKEGDPSVMLVHGLCGSHKSPYLIRLTRHLLKRGIRSIRLNLRNCGSGKGLARKFYHCGISEDIKAALSHMKSKYPHSQMVLIGFSLGGNLVLKAAGELGKEAKNYIEAVYAVSPPIKLVSSMRLLDHPNNRFFQNYFIRHLVNDVTELHKSFPDLEQISFPSDLTILDFDELYIAPRIGYSSALEYYRHSSSIYQIPNIAIACKILFAEDDPIIDHHDIDTVQLPDCVQVYKTDRGGHLGFLCMPNKTYGFRWMDGLLLGWIEEFLRKE
jgi:predicted alpha/beta-fold hydrolase